MLILSIAPDARKDGHIRGRIRWFVHDVGWEDSVACQAETYATSVSREDTHES